MQDYERDKIAKKLTKIIRGADEFDYLSGESFAKCAQAIRTVTEAEEASWVCSVGIWFWQNGLTDHALFAYDHAWELRQEPPILFNKAICLDDAGRREDAVPVMKEFLDLVAGSDEVEVVEKMLRDHGKEELWDEAREGA